MRFARANTGGLRVVAFGQQAAQHGLCLKESCGQLWSYEREGWARRFFENWRASLKWQRLKPYEKFAEMIDRHWDGIAAYCRLENKVSLGSKGSTTRSESFSGAPTACATRTIYGSKSSPACCRSYSRGTSIHRSGRL